MQRSVVSDVLEVEEWFIPWGTGFACNEQEMRHLPPQRVPPSMFAFFITTQRVYLAYEDC